MAGYSHLYSNYPETLITKHEYKNVDNTISSIVNEIMDLRLKGDYRQASIIESNNESLLKSYFIDNETLMALEEEIYNTQIFAKSRKQTIVFSDTLPSDDEIGAGDILIGSAVI